MTSFIIKRQDSGISIGNMVEPNTLDQLTLDAEIEKWNQTSDSKSVYHQYENRFPDDKDSYFHDSYDHSPERGVFVDMEKAKIFHINKLREIRKEKFNNLGFPVKLNPELENSILSDETKAKLKELRDFPQNMNLSNVMDHNELRNIIPDCLK